MIAVIAPFTSHSLCCKDRSCAWAALSMPSVLPPSRSSGVILRPSSSTSSKRKSRKSHLRFRMIQSKQLELNFFAVFFSVDLVKSTTLRACQNDMRRINAKWQKCGFACVLLLFHVSGQVANQRKRVEKTLAQDTLRSGTSHVHPLSSPIIPSNANKIQQESRNITKSMWLCRLCRLCACLGVEQKDRRKPGHFT